MGSGEEAGRERVFKWAGAHESAWAASEFQPPVVDYANDGRSEALRHDVTKKILLIGGICFALAIDAVGVAATAALPTR
jgi:hypothetical protein